MSAAVDVARASREDGDERSPKTDRDPYGERRIEVDADDLRTVSPAAWVSRVSSRIDDAVSRFTWGR